MLSLSPGVCEDENELMLILLGDHWLARSATLLPIGYFLWKIMPTTHNICLFLCSSILFFAQKNILPFPYVSPLVPLIIPFIEMFILSLQDLTAYQFPVSFHMSLVNLLWLQWFCHCISCQSPVSVLVKKL